MKSGKYYKEGKYIISGRECLKARSDFAETKCQRALQSNTFYRFVVLSNCFELKKSLPT